VPVALQDAIDRMKTRHAIEVLPLSKNVGLAQALNFGLAHARTEWVVRADADDYNVPNRFELQAAAIHRLANSVDLLGGAIQEIEPTGEAIAVRRTAETHGEILKYMARRNPFNHMTVAYRTKTALACGGYPDVYLKEDYALWAKMLSQGAAVGNLPDILVHAVTGASMYRRRGGTRYALAEIDLQRYLVQCGVKSKYRALIDGMARATVFLLPASARGLIYGKVLRTKS
jgi:glycosyltransferase involved in cell wall biosynthesis